VFTTTRRLFHAAVEDEADKDLSDDKSIHVSTKQAQPEGRQVSEAPEGFSQPLHALNAGGLQKCRTIKIKDEG
jgi:hypothetical protein